MVSIPLPLTSAPGHENHMESQGRLINCFAEALGESKEKVKRIRVPGLTERFTSTQTDCRDMIYIPGTATEAGRLWVTFGSGSGTLAHSSADSGALTVLATTFGAQFGGGTMAYNQKSPTRDKVLLTTASTVYLFDTGFGLAAYPGQANLPGIRPESVCCVGGYFFFAYQDGRVFASGLNDTTQNALSFATAFAKPDRLVRGVGYQGRLLLFGEHSTEVWTDVGSSPFPFQRAAVIPFGLVNKSAVAGEQDGFGAGLLWLANDNTIRMLDGYNAVKVSPPDLDRLLNIEDPDLYARRAGVYVTDGHAFWYITMFNTPATSTDFTWVLDLNTMKWHERASHLISHWRGWPTVLHYTLGNPLGNPGRWLCGDLSATSNASLYQIDPSNHTEDGDPLRARLESAAVSAFPARTRVLRADFEMETGVGITGGINPIETDPTLQISWSDDGGVTWGNPLTRALGQQAQYRDISVYNVGRTTRYGRRWRLDVSDPVYVNFIGGDQTAEPRR